MEALFIAELFLALWGKFVSEDKDYQVRFRGVVVELRGIAGGLLWRWREIRDKVMNSSHLNWVKGSRFVKCTALVPRVNKGLA
uniref:Uncharacterized protein n=1 Tax=Tanacetum cinerariifolium TaxID=118510 RepID=A0A699UL77_TANCI|nr:hypothetical protein [Tanacetum cinerariifolium]